MCNYEPLNISAAAAAAAASSAFISAGSSPSPPAQPRAGGGTDGGDTDPGTRTPHTWSRLPAGRQSAPGKTSALPRSRPGSAATPATPATLTAAAPPPGLRPAPPAGAPGRAALPSCPGAAGEEPLLLRGEKCALSAGAERGRGGRCGGAAGRARLGATAPPRPRARCHGHSARPPPRAHWPAPTRGGRRGALRLVGADPAPAVTRAAAERGTWRARGAGPARAAGVTGGAGGGARSEGGAGAAPGSGLRAQSLCAFSDSWALLRARPCRNLKMYSQASCPSATPYFSGLFSLV